jgi:hypothetical protein
MSDKGYHDDGSGRANDYSSYHAPGQWAQPDSGWKSYDQGKNVGVDRDKLEQIAKNLEDDLNKLKPKLDDVTNKANSFTVQHLGGSQTAGELYSAAQRAYQGFTQYYGEIEAAYKGIIENLRRAAKGYADTEDANTTDARSAYSGSTSSNPDGSRTGNTGAWQPE